MRRFLPLAPLILLAACGGAQTEDTPTDMPADMPSETGDRVALAPTADGQLPSAILGQAGPLQGRDLHYLEADAATTGYLAVPEGDGPFPALILVHEWNGLTDRVRHLADNFAAEGYMTLAADLFQGQVGASGEENRALMAAAEPNIISNLDAAVGWLKAQPNVTGRVGAMGWCYGGGVALSFGLDGVDHEATAIFYGQLVEDPAILSRMGHEVYGTFAEGDSGIPPAAVGRFEIALREVGIENDLHVYDAVGHGFWLRVDDDAAVRTAPALDAWQRLKAYLNRTVRAGN